MSASRRATAGLFKQAYLLPAVSGWPPLQWHHPTRTQYHFPDEKKQHIKMHATVCWQSSYHITAVVAKFRIAPHSVPC